MNENQSGKTKLRRVMVSERNWIQPEVRQEIVTDKAGNSRMEGVLYKGHYLQSVLGPGWFHCFSNDYEEFETGPGNFAIAIVEMLDGTVLSVEPALIRFIDPYTETNDTPA